MPSKTTDGLAGKLREIRDFLPTDRNINMGIWDDHMELGKRMDLIRDLLADIIDAEEEAEHGK